MNTLRKVMVGLAVGAGAAMAAGGAWAQSIDNTALGKPEFREHKATYGLVYKLPKDVTDVLGARINGPLKEKLLMLGLKVEADTFNIPHVTVVHVHSADPTTPKKILDQLPKGSLDPHDHAQGLLHDRGFQGRRAAVVARPRYRQERAGLRGYDDVQHRRHGGAHTLA